MPCYSPSYIARIVKPSGEVVSKWIGSNEYNDLTLLKDEYSGEKKFWFAQNLFDTDTHDKITWQRVPCGKCIGCRMDYSRSWADRMTYHVFGKEDVSWFITLTYSDENLGDLSHNANYDIYSLNYDHLRDFIKRVRNKFRSCDVDFFASGEYGDSSFRPHYHLILYNVPFDDLCYWKANDTGQPIYISDTLSDLWRNRGFCTISPFSWLGAAYTASYVEKKRDGRKLCEYTALGLAPERSFCSRRPGLAHDYYFDHEEEIWQNNGLNVSRSVNGSGHLGIPRYFRKLAEKTVEGRQMLFEYEKRQLEKSNILNPLTIDNSSFDVDNVKLMLQFNEREILNKTHSKKI